LAPAHARVTLIESAATAVADAKVNLQAWREYAEFHQIDVEDWVFDAAQSTGRQTAVPVDIVIADPARQGLDRAGLNALVATSAPVIILISCDPAAAARDLRLAEQAGYQIEAVKVLDVFPHTHHVELVSRLVMRSDLATSAPEKSSDSHRTP
jgi:23S rRNA (uracil1939-C5)-methyltransferase